MNPLKRVWPMICALWVLGGEVESLMALSFDGTGHYAARGEATFSPGGDGEADTREGILQSLDLNIIGRSGRAQVGFGINVFPNPHEAWLGGVARPRFCENSVHGEGECENSHQNTRYPGYFPLFPEIVEAYGQYDFEIVRVRVGRRRVDWGSRLFLSSGKRPFEVDASTFDGVEVEITPEWNQFQPLKVSIEFNKLVAIPTYVREPNEDGKTPFGINQYAVKVLYDDLGPGGFENQDLYSSPFQKQVGIAVSLNKSDYKRGSSTSLTFLDLYSGLFYKGFRFRGEAALWMGESADPNSTLLGGAVWDEAGDPAVNKQNSFAFGIDVGYTIDRTGEYKGPKSFHRRDGSVVSHDIDFHYAYAPGDSDGYYSNRDDLEPKEQDEEYKALTIRNRKVGASASAFHENYSPLEILFNTPLDLKTYAVDGIFFPTRFMNAQLVKLTYSFFSSQIGLIQGTVGYARLNESMPSSIKSFYNSLEENKRPVGYYSKNLGVEVNAGYELYFSPKVCLSAGAGLLVPGNALKVDSSKDPSLVYKVRAGLNFLF